MNKFFQVLLMTMMFKQTVSTAVTFKQMHATIRPAFMIIVVLKGLTTRKKMHNATRQKMHDGHNAYTPLWRKLKRGLLACYKNVLVCDKKNMSST